MTGLALDFCLLVTQRSHRDDLAMAIEGRAYHPGYFLPTVAGGLVGAYAAAAVHMHAVAAASFGLGVVCWLLLGSTVLGRLFFRSLLPTALVSHARDRGAAAGRAGTAWFELDRGAIDLVACALGGYAILMLLVQLRLAPVYSRLR